MLRDQWVLDCATTRELEQPINGATAADNKCQILTQPSWGLVKLIFLQKHDRYVAEDNIFLLSFSTSFNHNSGFAEAGNLLSCTSNGSSEPHRIISHKRTVVDNEINT